MADTKISALPASTTPLAGTEVLPVVQSGTTKQVSVANLTAGRSVATGPLAVSGTGNVSMSLSATSAGSPNFYIAPTGGGNAIISWTTSQALRLATADNASLGGFVERVNIDGSGNTTLSTGNLVIGTSGKGIDFSATSGTGTSELLSDYEEGTFTATLTTTGGSITLAAATDLCSYTKVGRQVTVTGLIIVSSVSFPTGGVSMNLPFAVGGDAESSLAGGTFVIFQDSPTYATTLEEATFEEGASSLTINMSAASIGAADQFRFSFTYFA